MDIRKNHIFQFIQFYTKFWVYSMIIVVLFIVAQENYSVDWEIVAMAIFFFTYSLFAYADISKTIKVMCIVLLLPLVFSLVKHQLLFDDIVQKLPLCFAAIVFAFIGKFFVYLFLTTTGYIQKSVKKVRGYLMYQIKALYACV